MGIWEDLEGGKEGGSEGRRKGGREGRRRKEKYCN